MLTLERSGVHASPSPSHTRYVERSRYASISDSRQGERSKPGRGLSDAFYGNIATIYSTLVAANEPTPVKKTGLIMRKNISTFALDREGKTARTDHRGGRQCQLITTT